MEPEPEAMPEARGPCDAIDVEPEPEQSSSCDAGVGMPPSEGVPGTGVPIDPALVQLAESSKQIAHQLIGAAQKLCEVELRRTGSEHSTGSIRTAIKDMRGVAAVREKELTVRSQHLCATAPLAPVESARRAPSGALTARRCR